MSCVKALAVVLCQNLVQGGEWVVRVRVGVGEGGGGVENVHPWSGWGNCIQEMVVLVVVFIGCDSKHPYYIQMYILTINTNILK